MLMPSQWWIAATPIDLRCGMDRLLVAVRATLGRDAFDGEFLQARACIRKQLSLRFDGSVGGFGAPRLWVSLQALLYRA